MYNCLGTIYSNGTTDSVTGIQLGARNYFQCQHIRVPISSRSAVTISETGIRKKLDLLTHHIKCKPIRNNISTAERKQFKRQTHLAS